MTSVERVKKICKERGIPIYKLEKDLGFGNGYIGQLKKGTFPDSRLAQIAKYLDVSLSSLIDPESIFSKPIDLALYDANEKSPSTDELSEVKKQVLDRLRKMSDQEVQKVIELLDVLDPMFK